MPLMGVVTGGVDFSSLFIALNGEHYDSLAQQAGAPTVNFGVFINNIISFMIARQGGSLALGDQLSLAGILYAQGNQEDKVAESCPASNHWRRRWRSRSSPTRRARGVIGQKFGTPAGTLFEVSIKSNLLILLYQSGEDQGRSDSCAHERDRPAGEFVDGRRRRQQQGARGRRESQDA